MNANVDTSLDDIIRRNKKKNISARGSRGGLLKNLARRSGLSARGGRGGQQSTRRSPIKKQLHTTTGAQLHISNLEFGVSNQDIKELFSEFGPLKKATVNYVKSGRSLGTAEVIFASKESAIKAIKQYNNVPLAGRAMDIKLVSDQVDSHIAPRPGGGVTKRNHSSSGRSCFSDRESARPPLPYFNEQGESDSRVVDLLDQKFREIRNKLSFSIPSKAQSFEKVEKELPQPNMHANIDQVRCIDLAAKYYSRMGKSLSDFYDPEKKELNLNFFRIRRQRNIVCLPLLEARVDLPENKIRMLKKKVKIEKKCTKRQIRRDSHRE